MILSDRLMKIVKFINKDTSILDIGTDHGYIPIYIVENGISKRVIASDISKGSLSKTEKLVKNKALESFIDIRLGDGLDVIEPNEVEGVILAGMGGILIQNILELNRRITDTIDYFIFQPMIASKELRKYLNENGFKIVDEELSKDGDKFYEIFCAVKGKQIVGKDIYFEISQRLIEKRHPLLKEFIENKIRDVNEIIENLKNKTSNRSIDRYNELDNLVKKYMEVLKEIET